MAICVFKKTALKLQVWGGKASLEMFVYVVHVEQHQMSHAVSQVSEFLDTLHLYD